MKALHKANLYCWTQFNEDRNIDFHSYVWVRPEGNIVFDPLPLSSHDQNHLLSLGDVSMIVVSNSDHIRDADKLAALTGASICGPAGERESFPIACTRWLKEGDHLVDGLDICSIEGSKTPGELAFVVEGDTLITGDLIRAHAGGSLCLLPEAKLKDPEQARAAAKRLASLPNIKAILPGDGWPVFRDGDKVLAELLASFD